MFHTVRLYGLVVAVKRENHMNSIWAEFTTESNAVDNLEKALYFLGKVKHKPEDWKWVIICCHSALYGFAVHVASGSNDSSVIKITKNNKKRLITFTGALKRCKSACPALILSDEEEKSITILQNEYRNNFEHFNPCSWIINVSGFPQDIENIINVIHRLSTSINFYIHLDEKERDSLSIVFDEFLNKLNELSDYYN